MTDQEVLKKATEKAEANGWLNYLDGIEDAISTNDWKAMLFSHDFAKAFFGEDKGHWLYIQYSGGFMGIDEPAPVWKRHLQAMVLEKNPIDYLRKFVEEK